MNKSEFVSLVVSRTGFTKGDVEIFLDAFREGVTEVLAKGNSLTLVGFGTFKVSERTAREGRNPQTGAALKIPAAKVPKFTAGKTLKDAVDAGKK